MKWGCFLKKSGKWGVFFTKKVDLSSTQGALFTVSVFFIFAFYFFGGCIRTQRTALPTGVDVVYWGVYAGIRRIPTSGVFLIAYTHLSDHK